MKKIFICSLIVMSLSACQAVVDAQVEKQVGNQPAQYKKGFRAGCNSGYAAAGNPYNKFTKNLNLYKNEELYKNGWDDGFIFCKSSYESTTNY